MSVLIGMEALEALRADRAHALAQALAKARAMGQPKAEIEAILLVAESFLACFARMEARLGPPSDTAASPDSAPSRRSAQRLLDGRLSLTRQEAARALGVSGRRMSTLLAEIPHVRDGAQVLVPVYELRRWLGRSTRRHAQHRRSRPPTGGAGA